MNTDSLCGARIRPDQTAKFCERLARDGMEPHFAQATAKMRPDFRKWADAKWQAKPQCFLWDAEIKLYGKMLPSWIQKIGVCIGMGHGRAWQDSIYWQQAFGVAPFMPLELAWEFTYTMSRNLPGKERWKGDGSVGAWAAEAGHDYGMLLRGQYGTIDLTRQREDLAAKWAESSVPQQLKNEAGGKRAESVMLCKTVDDVRRALVAGYGVARCADRATRAQRDADGFCGIQSSGGHCQALRGVFENRKGRTLFVEQQSWPGTAAPHGGGPLKLYDGSTRELPEGAGAISEDDVQYYLTHGEVWAMAPPREMWRVAG